MAGLAYELTWMSKGELVLIIPGAEFVEGAGVEGNV